MGSACKLLRSTFKLFKLCRLPILAGSSNRKFSVRISSWRFSHLPMLGFNTDNRFWSTFSIVNLLSLPIPSGNFSITFCERCKSVRDSRPPISSGRSSNRFSETSRHARVFSWPISGGKCCNWFVSSHNSWSAGNFPMCDGCDKKNTRNFE